VVGFAGAEQHATLLAPARAVLPPAFEFSTPMPYTAVPGFSTLISAEPEQDR
jgi:hypothetical protein